MSGAALGLVLLAAIAHATWNLLARRAQEKLAFLWCGTLVSSAVFLPLAIWLLATEPISPAGWAVIALSAGLEALYYWTLAQAYRYGDLSLVYPIARGTAPILVPVLAALFLGERLSGLAVVGIGLVVLGTVLIHTRGVGCAGGAAGDAGAPRGVRPPAAARLDGHRGRADAAGARLTARRNRAS